MNLGAALVLLKLAMDSGFTVSPITEPTTPTPENPQNVSMKPICGPGHYAYKDPLSGLWSCVRIPGGR
jgi:hypothetical protein